MSDEDKPLFNRKLKILITVFAVLFLTSLSFVLILEYITIEEFKSLHCRDREEYLEDFHDAIGSSSEVRTMVEIYNQECSSEGKYFLQEVPNGSALVFLPSSAMEEGVEYDIIVTVNQSDTSEFIDSETDKEREWEIKIGK